MLLATDSCLCRLRAPLAVHSTEGVGSLTPRVGGLEVGSIYSSSDHRSYLRIHSTGGPDRQPPSVAGRWLHRTRERRKRGRSSTETVYLKTGGASFQYLEEPGPRPTVRLLTSGRGDRHGRWCHLEARAGLCEALRGVIGSVIGGGPLVHLGERADSGGVLAGGPRPGVPLPPPGGEVPARGGLPV